MSDKTSYAQIDDWDHDGEERKNPGKGLRRRNWISWIPISASFLLGLATMGVIMLLTSASATPAARHMPPIRNGSDPDTGLPLSWSNGDCGNSPQDAKTRGCQYSIVLHAWLPESCLTEADTEDAKDMYEGSEWYYESGASGQNLTLEELGAGDYPWFYTTMDWHSTHCMYVWKRLHRVVLDPSQELDSYTAGEHHTHHCVDMIAGGRSLDDEHIRTKVFVKYPQCAK
jgi:hypothetical protein